MKEIWIPEIIVALFLLLPQLRNGLVPFGPVKRLEAIPGLRWLPFLALLICAGIFPAYGFRLECIPLFIYTVIYNLVIFPIAARIAQDDEPYDNGFFLNMSAFLLLAGTTAFALAFAPSLSPDICAENVRMVTVRDEEYGRDYYLRIYDTPETGNGGKKSPLVLVIPPESGSVIAVDKLCDELRKKGLTVVSYSRRGLDSPALRPDLKKNRLSPAALWRYWRAGIAGTVFWKNNAFGKTLEAARLEDIAFLFSRLRQNSEVSGPLFGAETSAEAVFLAGWNAGGSASVYFGASRRPGLGGIIAVESLFWTSYLPEERNFEQTPEGANVLRRLRVSFFNVLTVFKRLKTGGMGDIPVPDVPVLYIASDHVFEPEKPRYTALLKTAENAENGAVLAAVWGAGPLDYSDIPLQKPLYSLMSRGKEKWIWAKKGFPSGTASLIANFVSSALPPARAAQTDADEGAFLPVDEPEIEPPARSVVGGVVFKSWNLDESRYILDQ